MCIRESANGVINVSTVCTDMYETTSTIAVGFSISSNRCPLYMTHGTTSESSTSAPSSPMAASLQLDGVRLDLVRRYLEGAGATLSIEEFNVGGTIFSFHMSFPVWYGEANWLLF